MEYVYDITSDSYDTPTSFIDSSNTKLDTNLVKFADQNFSTIMERYYIDNTPKKNIYEIPRAITDIVEANKDLKAKNYFASLYGVNEGENKINSYYFSYDMEQNTKLRGVEYSVDEDLFSISYIMHIKLNSDGKFLTTYYNIKIENEEQKQLFMSKLTSYSEVEKTRIQNIIDKLNYPISMIISRKKNNTVTIYVREIKR